MYQAENVFLCPFRNLNMLQFAFVWVTTLLQDSKQGGWEHIANLHEDPLKERRYSQNIEYSILSIPWVPARR